MSEPDSTGAPSTPPMVRNLGIKIDRLGLDRMIIELLSINTPMSTIVDLCREELKKDNPNETISRATIQAWIDSKPEEFQKAIREIQHRLLIQHVWDFERQGIGVREDVSKKLKKLVDDDLEKIDELTTSQKKDIANILMKLVYVQESGERFMGINTKDGKRYKVDVNIKLDLIDRMKELNKKKMQEESIDVSYDEEEDEEEPPEATDQK
jgi:hypothetical protein